MSTVKTYKEGRFSQINLDDGNKVLLSYGATDMRVIKIGFLSLPKETIHIFDAVFTLKLISKIGYDMSKDIVKILASELVKADSLEKVKEICIKLERDKIFLKKYKGVRNE